MVPRGQPAGGPRGSGGMFQPDPRYYAPQYQQQHLQQHAQNAANVMNQNIEEEEEPHCPLCVEPLDETEKQFRPCPCGYQVCLFCYDRLKLELKGLCPSCRTPYGSEHPSKSSSSENLAAERSTSSVSRGGVSGGSSGVGIASQTTRASDKARSQPAVGTSGTGGDFTNSRGPSPRMGMHGATGGYNTPLDPADAGFADARGKRLAAGLMGPSSGGQYGKSSGVTHATGPFDNSAWSYQQQQQQQQQQRGESSAGVSWGARQTAGASGMRRAMLPSGMPGPSGAFHTGMGQMGRPTNKSQYQMHQVQQQQQQQQQQHQQHQQPKTSEPNWFGIPGLGPTNLPTRPPGVNGGSTAPVRPPTEAQAAIAAAHKAVLEGKVSSQDAAAALIKSLRQSHPDLLAPPAGVASRAAFSGPPEFSEQGAPFAQHNGSSSSTWFGGRAADGGGGGSMHDSRGAPPRWGNGTGMLNAVGTGPPSSSSERDFGFSDRELGLPLNLSEVDPSAARTPLYARRANGTRAGGVAPNLTSGADTGGGFPSPYNSAALGAGYSGGGHFPLGPPSYGVFQGGRRGGEDSGGGMSAYGEGGTCPCCMAFSTPSNAALNAHMDECLNRSLLDR